MAPCPISAMFLAWRLAHLDPAFLDLLGCFLGAGAAEWTPQQVANSVWRVAALSWQDWAMLGGVGRGGQERGGRGVLGERD